MGYAVIERIALLMLGGALVSMTSGCLATRTPAWVTVASLAIPAMPAAQGSWETAGSGPSGSSFAVELVTRGETEWEQRAASEHARAAVEAWGRALEEAPTDSVLWARLARAQVFLADAHVASDPPGAREASELFAAAITSAERSLLTRVPSLGAILRSGMPFSTVLGSMQLADVPALYWRTLALARWARGNGGFVQQSVREELRASMARVAELDRAYDGAGADRFLGDAWASASTLQGGDLERARAHFEYAIDAAPHHLATRVLFALDYATKVQDRALFERELRRVIASDPGSAEIAPENLAEQARARAALERMALLFP